jgi:hypothetical protein
MICLHHSLSLWDQATDAYLKSIGRQTTCATRCTRHDLQIVSRNLKGPGRDPGAHKEMRARPFKEMATVRMSFQARPRASPDVRSPKTFSASHHVNNDVHEKYQD